MILTKSQWAEFEAAGELIPDDFADETVKALQESLEETSRLLCLSLAGKPIRNADECLARVENLLS